MVTSHRPREPVSLRRLFPGAQFFGARDIVASGCACDSRVCQEGDLFAALVGTRLDGHEFAADAVARGARSLLLERPLPIEGIPSCIVPNAAAAYARLCQALAGDPSQRLKVIGVTGTNGKTTTSLLVASVLVHAGMRTAVMGTLGYCAGTNIGPSTHTTPPAAALAAWLVEAEAAGCTHGVLEVSSHALAQSRVAGIEFDAACFTNIRHDHLDYHGVWKNYRNAKRRLLDHLVPEGLVVLNADDPGSIGLADDVDGPVLSVGLANDAELRATVIERLPGEQTFLLTAGNDTAAVRTRIIGDHHVSNCLMAAAVGLGYGIDLPTVARGLEAVEQVDGRLERIDCGQEFGVWVDYAHTPDALEIVLATLREVAERRVICVFGAGGDRDRRKRSLMGHVVARMADHAVITSDNPRGENPADIASHLLRGFEDRSRVEVVLDRRAAIHRAIESARPGDCVLIAGKGHEMYQEIGRERQAFDDREVARNRLVALAPTAARPARMYSG